MDDQQLMETTLSSETVYKGRLLEVRCDRVALPNGVEASREYIAHPGAVVILAQLPDGRLLFERQFRYPLKRVFLELPAGKIDAGEDPRQTAERELYEETGYMGGAWRYLGVMHPCIGYSNELIEIYLATEIQGTGIQQLDAGEFISVIPLTLTEACNKVLSGEITDAKTISALFWAERVLYKPL